MQSRYRKGHTEDPGGKLDMNYLLHRKSKASTVYAVKSKAEVFQGSEQKSLRPL